MSYWETTLTDLQRINGNPYFIECIKNPSEEVQLAAVKQSGGSIQFIKNPSREVQIAAVNQNWRALRHIKDPAPGVCLAAIKKSMEVLDYCPEYFQEFIKTRLFFK